MLITRKKHCPRLTLHSESLDRVYLFKYLGVSISYNFCWSAHISDIVARAKRVIGLIYRKFYRLCNTSTLKKLYLTCSTDPRVLLPCLGSFPTQRYWNAWVCAKVCH